MLLEMENGQNKEVEKKIIRSFLCSYLFFLSKITCAENGLIMGLLNSTSMNHLTN
jgi:hypothetical protein